MISDEMSRAILFGDKVCSGGAIRALSTNKEMAFTFCLARVDNIRSFTSRQVRLPSLPVFGSSKVKAICGEVLFRPPKRVGLRAAQLRRPNI